MTDPEIDPQEIDISYPCAVCGQPADECICPECPACGGQGDPTCYDLHSLTRSFAQVALKAEADRLDAEYLEAESRFWDDEFILHSFNWLPRYPDKPWPWQDIRKWPWQDINYCSETYRECLLSIACAMHDFDQLR